MTPNPASPGVYIEEVPSGVRPIAAVSTSIALFIGQAHEGPAGEPRRCLSYPDFETAFSSVADPGELARSVGLFFQNGGSDCHVMRIAEKARQPTLDHYRVAFRTIDRKVDSFNLMVLPKNPAFRMPFTKELWKLSSGFCTKRNALLLMDPPDEWTSPEKAWQNGEAYNIANLRQGLALDRCAMFYPGIRILENGSPKAIGPSGAIAGLMARTDAQRGVWKAPAGIDALLKGISGVERSLSDAENGDLNRHGINAIRVFPAGTVNWGARTLAGEDSLGSEWKYIPVRRMASHIEESLRTGTQWAVFEQNGEPLWSRLGQNIGAFMQDLYRNGAFQGATPKDTYFVKCDGETTTRDDINNGRVNILVGFAPLKPAEFVIVKICQKAAAPV
jgi:phage tail sheath protein FI